MLERKYVGGRLLYLDFSFQGTRLCALRRYVERPELAVQGSGLVDSGLASGTSELGFKGTLVRAQSHESRVRRSRIASSFGTVL